MRSKARRLNQALYSIDDTYYVNEGKRQLSDAQLCVLYVLDDGNPHSQREISQEWLVPKTSVNTIVKRWEKEGLITMTAIPGKRREKYLLLTDAGRAYAKRLLSFLYRAEEKALQRTIEKYSETFIEAVEFFNASLKEAFDEEDDAGGSGRILE